MRVRVGRELDELFLVQLLILVPVEGLSADRRYSIECRIRSANKTVSMFFGRSQLSGD